MKVAIVLGATGLVGKKLVDRLVIEPCFEKVVAITRREVEYTSPKVVNEVIDFERIEQYLPLFSADVIFSCLGTTIKQAGTVAQQRKVDFTYQYQAAKLAAENKVSHYILVSSYGANQESKSAYLKMKGELENAVSALTFKQISILQPSLLKGERESFRIGETIGNAILPTLCKLPCLKKYRPISGDEVASKMVSVSLSPRTGKQIYRLDELFNIKCADENF
ncbi:NAD(P)H-binding protein [Colwelliaceae bacterium MEBiC 14330]